MSRGPVWRRQSHDLHHGPARSSCRFPRASRFLSLALSVPHQPQQPQPTAPVVPPPDGNSQRTASSHITALIQNDSSSLVQLLPSTNPHIPRLSCGVGVVWLTSPPPHDARLLHRSVEGHRNQRNPLGPAHAADLQRPPHFLKPPTHILPRPRRLIAPP